MSKYNVCFTLGDPSGDGHANTSEYHMVSNYSAKEIDKAYKKATEILGFDFVENVGVDYQDNELREPYFSILVEKGIIKKEDYEYEDENYLNTYLNEDEFIDIFESICQLVLPDLVIDYRNLEEDRIFSLEGAAYGIAYHGE